MQGVLGYWKYYSSIKSVYNSRNYYSIKIIKIELGADRNGKFKSKIILNIKYQLVD